MHFIANATETRKIATESFHKECIVIYHFFDFRAGEGISNNFEGLLRSLLFQLNQEFPKSIATIPILRDSLLKNSGSPTSGRFELSLDALWQSLKKVFRLLPNRTLILLDGLDEYGGEKAELVIYIKKLCHPNVKVCLASRPDPPFPDAFSNVPTFQMHVLNRPGISTFTSRTLNQFFSDARYDQNKLSTFTKTITDLSQGVFLWARFAVFEMICGLTHGEEVGSRLLNQRLKGMPKEL